MGAWATANKLLLGQLVVEEKSNEITAMPKLLDILCVKGCILRADAMNCQKEIACKVIDKQADYLLAVKGNQQEPYRQIQQSFQLENPNLTAQTLEKDHGRIEKRTCEVITDLKWVEQAPLWKNLTAIVRVISERTIVSEDKASSDTRYYIYSGRANADAILAAARAHWGIENSLHWSLDVTFQEDNKRNRIDNSAVNAAFLRRITLNLLKKDPDKRSIQHKRQKACRDNLYLEKIIFKSK